MSKGEVSEPKNKMTPEQLLKPRYKVVADYPGSDFNIGDVIEMDEKAGWFTEKPDWVTKKCGTRNGGATIHSIKFFEPFPNIFKPLAWYEEREASEMPEYVKDKYNNFHWVRRWEFQEDDETGEVDVVAYFDKSYMAHEDWLPDQLDLIPATEAEYQDYLKNKQK